MLKASLGIQVQPQPLFDPLGYLIRGGWKRIDFSDTKHWKPWL